MKSKVWAMILATMLLVCLGLSILLLQPGSGATRAEIYVDGRLWKTVDLRYDQMLTVESDWGSNTVTVQDGKIAVTAATCPDHHCMNRGFCDGGVAIVCLPNRLVIKFVESGGVDAAVG